MHSLSSFLAEEFDIMKLVFHGTSFGEKLIEFLKRKALKNIGLKLDLVPPSCPLGILGGTSWPLSALPFTHMAVKETGSDL